MNQYLIIAAILLPIAGSVLIAILPFKKKVSMHIFTQSLVLLTSALSIYLVLSGKTEVFHLLNFVANITISFRIDGASMVFAGLISVLWPLATLYAFEYMEKEEHENVFFMFFTMTYGVTLGIAFSANIVTMYFFYELLTLATVPLVMHTLSREAILATRKYLYYSIGGAAFALMGMIFIVLYGSGIDFTLGGTLSNVMISNRTPLLLWIYFLSFMGFGVKSAIFPVSSWLPDAGVAPTPVTALLHAVAVVNAGAFAIIRLTYYCYGTGFLKGTWVQYACMSIAIFTIIYGCSRALKETHIKRRLAWSTVGNLSYVIFGATIMTPFGLIGAFAHFIFHGFMKICAFLCAGAFMHQTGKSYVIEMNGAGRKMKIVFICFLIASLGLMGVPGFAGFISKWMLTQAAVESKFVLSYVGIAVLMLSALLTAIYMLSIVYRAFLPGYNSHTAICENTKDPSWRMCFPLIFCAVCVILLGIFSQPIIDFLRKVAFGII